MFRHTLDTVGWNGITKDFWGNNRSWLIESKSGQKLQVVRKSSKWASKNYEEEIPGKLDFHEINLTKVVAQKESLKCFFGGPLYSHRGSANETFYRISLALFAKSCDAFFS